MSSVLRPMGGVPDADGGRAVQRHYDVRPEETDRVHTPAYRVRCVNNWAKAMLAEQYVARGDTVVDLCGGRGGDLGKWQRCGARRILLVDASAGEVARARERWNGGSAATVPHVSFVCADAFAPYEQLSRELPGDIVGSTADVVACHFALHYACRHAESLYHLARNVWTLLRPGGRFVCIYPDAERITALLRGASSPAASSPPLEYTDPSGLLQLTYSGAEPAEADCANNPSAWPLYGAQYWFTLRGSIEHCPESLVHTGNLHAVLASAGGTPLVCEQDVPLDTYCWRRYHGGGNTDTAAAAAAARNAYHRMVPSASAMTVDEWRVVCLYRVGVFVRADATTGGDGGSA